MLNVTCYWFQSATGRDKCLFVPELHILLIKHSSSTPSYINISRMWTGDTFVCWFFATQCLQNFDSCDRHHFEHIPLIHFELVITNGFYVLTRAVGMAFNGTLHICMYMYVYIYF